MSSPYGRQLSKKEQAQKAKKARVERRQQAMELVKKAIEILRTGRNFMQAVELLTDACNLMPNVPRYFFVRGNAYYALDLFERAFHDYCRAIRLKDKEPLYFTSRALTLRKLHSLDDAIDDASIAVELEPDNGVYHFNRGLILYDAGDYKRAEEDFSVAIAQQRLLYRALFNRSNCRRKMGDMTGAIEDLQLAVETDGTSPAAYNALGLTYCEQEEYSSALQMLNKAVAANSTNPIYLNNRGLVKYHLGSFTEALTDFNASINHQRDERPDPTAYFHRGNTYLALEKPYDALLDLDYSIRIFLRRREEASSVTPTVAAAEIAKARAKREIVVMTSKSRQNNTQTQRTLSKSTKESSNQSPVPNAPSQITTVASQLQARPAPPIDRLQRLDEQAVMDTEEPTTEETGRAANVTFSLQNEVSHGPGSSANRLGVPPPPIRDVTADVTAQQLAQAQSFSDLRVARNVYSNAATVRFMPDARYRGINLTGIPRLVLTDEMIEDLRAQQDISKHENTNPNSASLSRHTRRNSGSFSRQMRDSLNRSFHSQNGFTSSPRLRQLGSLQSIQRVAADALVVCRQQHSVGLAYQALGAYEYALEHFETALKLWEEHDPSRYHAALMYYALGDHTRAEEELELLLEKDGDDFHVLEARGLARQALGRHLEAIHDFTSALALREDGEASYHRAVSRLALPDPDLESVSADLRDAIKNGWRRGEVYDKAASSYLLSDRLESAIKAYTSAIDLDPTNLSYLCRRSQCFREIGDSSSAEDDLTRSINIAAREALIRENTMEHPLQRSQTMEFKVDERGFPIQFAPPVHTAISSSFIGSVGTRGQSIASGIHKIGSEQTNMIRTASGVQKYSSAKDRNISSKSNEPQDSPGSEIDAFNTENLPENDKEHLVDPNLYYLRGLARYDQDNFDGSIEDLERALRHAPEPHTLPDIYYIIGLAHANSERYQQAVDAFSNALVVRSNLSPQLEKMYLHERAKCRQMLNEHELAIRDFTAVLKLNPSNAHAMFRRGFSYKALQQYHDAANDFENARRAAPNNPYLVVNYSSLTDISTVVLCAAGEEPEFIDRFEDSVAATGISSMFDEE